MGMDELRRRFGRLAPALFVLLVLGSSVLVFPVSASHSNDHGSFTSHGIGDGDNDNWYIHPFVHRGSGNPAYSEVYYAPQRPYGCDPKIQHLEGTAVHLHVDRYLDQFRECKWFGDFNYPDDMHYHHNYCPSSGACG
jgi:hypothetical protein